MPMTPKVLLGSTALVLLSGCATTPQTVQITPMELQAMQARNFEVDKEAMFPAVMSVFQDLGYTIDSADIQTGFITASSAATTDKNELGVFMLGRAANQYTDQTRATATVENLAQGGARVRLNFVNSRKASSGYGRSSAQDVPIQDPSVYQNAFEKIETALFVRSAS